METILSDHELMMQVRNGDLEALSILFERHSKRLYNFFLRSLGDPPASEDLVQDVFLRILNYRTSYQSNGSFIPWMFGIARNARIDYYRKNNRSPEYREDMNPHGGNSPDPESLAAQQGDLAMLQRALHRMDPDKREVLILSRLQDLRYAEISKILNISVSAVKVRVHRALKELRKQYYELTGETNYEL